MPAKAFSAPGPYCMAKTPAGFPFITRAQPSALWTPTRSLRQMTRRSPPATAASQNGVETPSRFRISVIASMTSIGVAPLGRCGVGCKTLPCAGALRQRPKPQLSPYRRRSVSMADMDPDLRRDGAEVLLDPVLPLPDTRPSAIAAGGPSHENRAHRELYLWYQEF